jgi:hypothetical protein
VPTKRKKPDRPATVPVSFSADVLARLGGDQLRFEISLGPKEIPRYTRKTVAKELRNLADHLEHGTPFVPTLPGMLYEERSRRRSGS